jgi:hypothetical protein
LETRALFAGSQGRTVARAGRNTCGPLSARLDLKAPAVPRSDTDHTGTIYLTGIDANGKVAERFRRHQLLRLTLERKELIIRQLCWNAGKIS